jgi:putative hemolysin
MNSLAPLCFTDTYTLTLAASPDDVRAAQRLRFEVFNLELHEGLPQAFFTGYDADEFDDACDHLIVLENATRRVVGTYRLQTGASAARHHGFYSAREFDFTPFEANRGEILELGRACVAADHRNHLVLGLLWRGIANYARANGARYLVGCSSLTSQDEAAGLAAFDQLVPHHLAAPEWRTLPLPALRCRRSAAPVAATPIPRLMRAYLALGARICGEPAIDREFSTIDFLTWVDLQSLPARVLQKFFT